MNDTFTLYLDLQNMIESDNVPEQATIEHWIKKTLSAEAEFTKSALNDEYELTVRIVDKDEIKNLNNTYRHKDKSTNVLSFPFDSPPEVELPLLGDLIICHDVVLEEAEEQQKAIFEHWAHMIVHGVLHLKGYDHIEDSEAQIMEALEIQILKQLNIANPYQ